MQQQIKMTGDSVELEVKLLHAGETIEDLRNYGRILEEKLKLPGVVDYGMKRTRGETMINSFIRQLELIKRQEETSQNNGTITRAVIIYSDTFFKVMETNREGTKKVAELVCYCLHNGFLAEIVIDDTSHKISTFFIRFGIQRPPQAKPIASCNYIGQMDHGAFVEAIYKQWFGPDAKLSSMFGGDEAMDVDDSEYGDYKPYEVRIIHFGLNREDVLRPLGRAFEDDVEICGQATYETYKKKTRINPDGLVVKDMKNVMDDRDDQSHGVLMWDAKLFQLLKDNHAAMENVQEFLQQDNTIPRQFANVLMKDVELGHFKIFPGLYKTLVESNRVVRLENCLGKDGESINFHDLARAVFKVWIGAQPPISTSTKRQETALSKSTGRQEAPVQMVQAIPRSQKDPVESYDPSASTSSMELEIDAMSDPDNPALFHSVERYGPALSKGQSSEGSSTKTVDKNDPTIYTTPSNHVLDGENAAVRMVVSGANMSFSHEQAQKAQLNERSLTSVQGNDQRMKSSVEKESGVKLSNVPDQRLLSEGGISQKPCSLRGPSLQEDEPQQPICQPQESRFASGCNKLAYNTMHRSVPMDEKAVSNVRNHQMTAATQKPATSQKSIRLVTTSDKDGRMMSVSSWSQPRNNSSGSLQFGRQSLLNQAASSVTAETQTTSNGDGRMMSGQPWSQPRNNSSGSLQFGRQSLPNQAASTSVTAEMQTTSNEDGRMMSAQPWNQPRNNSSGSLQFGRQNLPNQAASTSVTAETQTTPNGDGRMMSAQPWNQPRINSHGSLQFGSQSLLNQAAATPSAATESNTVSTNDSAKVYYPPNDPEAQHCIVTDAHAADSLNKNNEIVASKKIALGGNSSRPQAVVAGSQTYQNPVTSSDNRTMKNSEPQLVVSQDNSLLPSFEPSGGNAKKPIEVVTASGERSLLRRQDERDNQDMSNSQDVHKPVSEEDQMYHRQPADGQNNSLPNFQQNTFLNGGDEVMRKEQSEKDFGLLRADGSYSKGTGFELFSLQPVPHQPLISNDDVRSTSVPSDFRQTLDMSKQEGLYILTKPINKMNIPFNGLESEASVSGTSGSNNKSVEEPAERKLSIKDLDQNCIKKIKIVLDPLKTIVADWRNVASSYGVDNATINYWKSQPEKDKGPTEHLIEHLDITVDQLKDTLTTCKRFDVLEVLRKAGY